MVCTSRKWTIEGNVLYYLRETGKSIVTDRRKLGQQSELQALYPLSTRDYPCHFLLCCAVCRFADSLQVLNEFSSLIALKSFILIKCLEITTSWKKTSEVLRRTLRKLQTSAPEQSRDEHLDRQLQGSMDRQSQRSATDEFRQVHNI